MLRLRHMRSVPYAAVACGFIAVFAALGGACSSSDSAGPAASADAGADAGDTGATGLTDDQYAATIVTSMHDALLEDLDTLSVAAVDLQNAAPVTSGRGWDATADAAAIAAMKDAWVRARNAYEHVEGAFAPLFPTIDNSLDARYDDFMTQLLGSGGDANLFDDKGVTGLHAVERILYVDSTPQHVVDFEKTLPGYVAAKWPSTQQEAADFKGLLCAKIVADVADLKGQWQPAKINIAVAFQGLISLMNEQREKVTKASTSEEESRYSQRTMADLRDNLDGTTTIYAIFQPWITSKANAGDPTKDGPTIDAKITAGFKELAAAYAKVSGDGIPQPPDTWSAENPSPADLATPFGQLYGAVKTAVDPNTEEGVVFEMNRAAAILGFPQFQQH